MYQTKLHWDLELTRCMRGGFPQTTPTNKGTLGLFNNSTAGELLIVWSAYLWFLNLGEAGFGVFKGSIGGTVQKSNSIWTRMAPLAGVVTYLDTATAFDLDQHLPSGMTFLPVMQVNIPWAILDPGWSFIIQAQANANQCAANVIWQSVVDLTR